MAGQIAAAVLVLFFLVGSVFSSFALQEPEDSRSEKSRQASNQQTSELPAPVDDMHHFMEYISQPAYEQLKTALAQEPADRQAWSPIKSGAMILAESSILVTMRAPEENAEIWREISKQVHRHGADLYQAARRRKFDEAKNHYSKMIDNCNRCHSKFADGEHQLEK